MTTEERTKVIGVEGVRRVVGVREGWQASEESRKGTWVKEENRR